MIAMLGLVAMPDRRVWAQAPDQTLVFDGAVPDGGPDHFFVEFEVPTGIVEIEVRHTHDSTANILDWGLHDPGGFRGWGGGNGEPAVVGLQAASRSYLPGEITPGTWRVVVGKAKIVGASNYHIEIDLRTAATLAPQPERSTYAPAPALETGARWYAGDFHTHSVESGDARPSLAEMMTFAADRGLDFIELSDHNTTAQCDFINAAQARGPSVLLIPGIEWTSYAGHGNAIGATGWVEHKIGQPGATVEAAVAAIHQQGALFSINHPVLDLGDLCIGCAWGHTLAPEQIDAVEIATTGLDQAGKVFNDDALAFWDSLCATGRHVAAIGGSDDHKAGVDLSLFQSPIGDPTTMVFASELSVAGILQGVRDGRTVVKLQGPGDAMLELWTSHELTGDTVRADDEVVVRAIVSGGGGHQLVFVVDGVEQPAIPVDGAQFEATYSVQAPASGETRVRAELKKDDIRRVVASHVWIGRCNGTDCSPLIEEPGGTTTGDDGAAESSGDGASSDGGADAGQTGGASGEGSGCACTMPMRTDIPPRGLAVLGVIVTLLGFSRRRTR